MTVDDLARLICETQNVDGFKCTCPVLGEPDWCQGNRAKAQARAVVRALRDEIEDTYEREGCSWDGAHAYNRFNEILGDAGEKLPDYIRTDNRVVIDPGTAYCAPATATGFFDFEGHLAHQAMWSEATFGPGRRTAGVCDHIRKELVEVEADPEDTSEWIDVVILALDGAWRAGLSPRQIIDGIVAKQRKNEGRTWPDWRTADPNKAIEHDRAKEAANEQ